MPPHHPNLAHGKLFSCQNVGLGSSKAKKSLWEFAIVFIPLSRGEARIEVEAVPASTSRARPWPGLPGWGLVGVVSHPRRTLVSSRGPPARFPCSLRQPASTAWGRKLSARPPSPIWLVRPPSGQFYSFSVGLKLVQNKKLKRNRERLLKEHCSKCLLQENPCG